MVHVKFKMQSWIFICIETFVLFNRLTDAASVRLVDGDSRYGFVEQNIGSVWKPVCPGENDDTEHLAKPVCTELGFADGNIYKMTTPITASEWWYNEFTRSDQPSVIPKLDAYVTKKWISVSKTSQYARCQSSTLAVHCTGKVALDIASSYTLKSVSERGFGRVVISTDKENYIDPGAIGAKESAIICNELGFNFSSEISDDQVVGYSKGVNTYSTHKYTCSGSENSILDCATSPLTNPLYKPAVVACSNTDVSQIPDGSVRIGDQSLVEMRYHNTWGLICGDGFTDIDAKVVCKSLGFNSGMASTQHTSKLQRLYPVFIKSLQCDDTKTNPVDCNKQMWDNRCNNVAQARCFNTETEGVYTLTTGGGSLGNHFIERSSKNQKGILAIIMDKRLSDGNPAPKLCKGLGYNSGFLSDLPGSKSLPQGKYWLAVYSSSAIECITLDECFKNDWTFTGDLSEIREHVKMISCHNSVYLNGNGISGIVNYNSGTDQPHTIDEATVSADEVNLICKGNGFPDGGRKITEDIYETQVSDGLVSMNCTSDASSMSDCTFHNLQDTTNVMSLVIACNLPTNLPDKIFLGNDGRVNININNNPVQFCVQMKRWTDKEASVACRQLGFSSFIYYSKSRGTAAVGYKSVTCQGNEESLSECSLEDTTLMGCEHVAAITCYNPDDTKFELRDGGDRYGRVWITRGGKEGYFCPEKFDEEDASTVCRELGFEGGDDIKMPSITTIGTKWWHINTNCDDDTKVIEGCEGGEWKYIEPTSDADNTCTWKTASVFCYSYVRLEEAPYLSYGVVRMTGTKVRYSSDSFSTTEANITCKGMGYAQGGKVIPSTSFRIRDDPVLVQCNGDERSLKNCTVQSGTSDDTKFASVTCETGESIPVDGTLKIIDDFRVLLVKNGIWGGLCAESWTDNDATVVCKQLKGSTGGKSMKRGNKLNVPFTNFKEAWNCVGTESKLDDCPIDQSQTEKYCRESAGVYCDNHQAQASKEEVYPNLPGVTFPTEDEPDSTNPPSTGSYTQGVAFPTEDEPDPTKDEPDSTNPSSTGSYTQGVTFPTEDEPDPTKDEPDSTNPSSTGSYTQGCFLVFLSLVIVTTTMVLQ